MINHLLLQRISLLAGVFFCVSVIYLLILVFLCIDSLMMCRSKYVCLIDVIVFY